MFSQVFHINTWEAGVWNTVQDILEWKTLDQFSKYLYWDQSQSTKKEIASSGLLVEILLQVISESEDCCLPLTAICLSSTTTGQPLSGASSNRISSWIHVSHLTLSILKGHFLFIHEPWHRCKNQVMCSDLYYAGLQKTTLWQLPFFQHFQPSAFTDQLDCCIN